LTAENRRKQLAKPITREQAIRTGQRLRKAASIAWRVQALLVGHRARSQREEILLDTEFGKARTLWYGFENPEIAPLFFDLHGGGFILGTADMDHALNLAFHQEVGCKVISIDYAKAPEFPYPVAVNQVYAVVKHVFENAGEYAIDGQKVAIGGHSAGGNLSTVTCMRAKKAGEFQFVCQVLDYPPLDLATSPLNKPKPRGGVPPRMAMVFDACYVDPAQARDPYVSPVYATLEDLQGLPPALLILAGRDSLHDEGLQYGEMLKTAGVPTECHDYPNARHGFTLRSSADTTDAMGKMVSFLKRHLQ
jgi:acetyl esterase